MILSHPLPPASVRARVAEILPWAESGVWHTLFGGRTNAAWQVLGEGDQSAVLKVYRTGTENPLFPNDPKAEAAMLRHLKGHDIAPDLIADFSIEGMACNLYHALAGDRWTTGVAEVATLIQRLHRVRPPKGLRQATGGTEAVLNHAEAILLAANAELDKPAELVSTVVPGSEQPVLLHCDIVPGNLIQGDRGLHLIDWQCPATGDATEDLAVFLSPAMQLLYRGQPLSADEESAFLSAFPMDQQDRYHALAPAYHYRMAAYCLWQISRGRQEYDDALKVELAALGRA